MEAIFIFLAVIEGLIILVLLIMLVGLKTKISRLQNDNRELIRRLKLVSKSKIVE